MDTSPWNSLLAALGLCLILSATGCGNSPYKMAPVHGTVSIDGQLMNQGKVMFTPMATGGELNPGKPAYGRIQPDGSFVLYTYGDDDGAVVGEHSVTVINSKNEGSAAANNASKFRRIALPRHYEVVAGQDNEINIELAKQDIAQYGR